MNNINQAVLILIIANVLVSMKGFKDYSFLNKYKFQVNSILSGEKIRTLTSGFLHVDWMHLGFNMYALYLFGDIVAQILGISRYGFEGHALKGIKTNHIIVLLVPLVPFLVLYMLLYFYTLQWSCICFLFQYQFLDIFLELVIYYIQFTE